jgi:hypothetical protein
MCEFCEPQPKRRDMAYARAELFDRMAVMYRKLGDGNIDPHGESSKPMGYLARTILREVVEGV